jgi:predicted TIM-barrel fold metal-dependent hydrolase
MSTTAEKLLEPINGLEIIDTHEHLPTEETRPAVNDVLGEWLTHYFSCDLLSAGLSLADLDKVRDPKRDLHERWAMVAPAWHAAESTGYGRSLALAARDIYDIPDINGKTIGELNKRFLAARAAGGHHKRVLRDLSRIAVCIRDGYLPQEQACVDPYVFAMRPDPFIDLRHYQDARARAAEVDMSVHSLEDWVEVTRRHISKAMSEKRVVCLKSGLAYARSLRYDKASHADAEREFLRLFEDRHLPDWRPPMRLGPAFDNYMQHQICGIADDLKLAYQFHTGIHEGSGNILYDSNPVLLSNLFLEYRNVRFDVFHMGYPYVMELGVLAKNFPNVFIDMCWGHVISPEASRRALVEWLDTVPANKISAFGGDYGFVDGVYGHQYIARRNVAASLAVKVDDGSMSLTRAKEIAYWVFVDNPRRLFGLDHSPAAT